MIATHGAQLFTTTIVCSRGVCPGGATYAWTLSNSLASLNSTTFPSVRTIAGPSPGPVTLFVNVTLNSRTVGASVLITIIPGRTSVRISPSIANVSSGVVTVFNVTPLCSAGACPSGVAYHWSLSNYLLGTLNYSYGPSVTFHAYRDGTLNISVTATALNETVGASAPINIASPTSSAWVGPFGLTEVEVIGLVAGIVAVVILAVILIVRKKGPRSPTPVNPPP